MAWKDKTGQLTATLVEPRPGHGIFQIANWAQLSEELPAGAKSGATVAVAGRRSVSAVPGTREGGVGILGTHIAVAAS